MLFILRFLEVSLFFFVWFPILLVCQQTTVSLPPSAATYTSLEVNWTAPANHSTKDELFLYVESPTSFIYSIYVNGTNQTSGSALFPCTVIIRPGSYFVDYVSSSSKLVIATSKTVNITWQGYDIYTASSSAAYNSLIVNWTAPACHDVNDSLYLYSTASSSAIIWATVGNEGDPSGSHIFPCTSLDKPDLFYVEYVSYSTGEIITRGTNINVTWQGYSISLALPSGSEYLVGNWTAPVCHSPSDSVIFSRFGDSNPLSVQIIYSSGQSFGNFSFSIYYMKTPGLYYAGYQSSSTGEIIVTSGNISSSSISITQGNTATTGNTSPGEEVFSQAQSLLPHSSQLFIIVQVVLVGLLKLFRELTK